MEAGPPLRPLQMAQQSTTRTSTPASTPMTMPTIAPVLRPKGPGVGSAVGTGSSVMDKRTKVNRMRIHIKTVVTSLIFKELPLLTR